MLESEKLKDQKIKDYLLNNNNDFNKGKKITNFQFYHHI